MAIGGERDIQRLALGLELRQLPDEINDPFPQQRLAAGKSNLRDAKSNQNPSHAKVIGERKIAVEGTFISGPAIDALVVAAVCDRDPQVGDGAPEFVVKKHRRSPLVVGRWLRTTSDHRREWKGQAGRETWRARFLSKALFGAREALAFPPAPSGLSSLAAAASVCR